jgi:hypothetical protein
MIITDSWTQVTTSSGLGAIIQRHSITKVLVAYAAITPTTEHVFSVRTYEAETFHDAQAGEYIWVRAESGSASVTVEEVDIVVGGASSPNGGFMDYNDTSTTASALVLASDTWTAIPNDGLGAFTNKTYKPNGVTELMNGSGQIDCSELTLGDYILIRNDYTVTPSGNNQILKFRYTLGTGGGSYTLEKSLGRMDEGGSIPYRFSLTVDEIYMGDANSRDNVIGIEVKSSGNATLVNAGTVISVVKRVV